MINYRAHNGYDVKAASDEAAELATPDGPGVSLTVQSQAEDADINVLMHRYGITGRMPENVRIPSYGDFTEVTDFRSALEAVRRAEEGFMELPARVRAEFQNDPQLLLQFAADPANLPRMRELGLAKEVSNGSNSSSVGVAGGGSGSAPAGGGAAAGAGFGSGSSAVGGGGAARGAGAGSGEAGSGR